MSTSAIPLVLGYLVDTFTASTQLGAAADPVAVYYCDNLSSDFAKRSLWIGTTDPDGGGALTGGTGTQNWVGPGNRKRDEHLSIPCMVEVWTGDEQNMRGAVESAFALLGIVEDLTRNNANLGGAVLFTDPGVTSVELKHGNTDMGALARLLFSIDCFARIGT